MPTVGVIAGQGALPLEIVRGARRAGRKVVVVGVPGLSDPRLADEADDHHWLEVGQLGALVQTLCGAGVHEVVMAGKVPKSFLYSQQSELKLDPLARSLLSQLANRQDDSILGVIADTLCKAGLEVCEQAAFSQDLLARVGPLTARGPTEAELADLRFGWPVAKSMGGLDIGQSVVVRQGAVMAVEAIEGTDHAIARGGALAGPGAVVVKVAKPNQDPRFDLPAIGPTTIEALIGAQASALAIEADLTIVALREELVARADEAGIAVIAFPAQGPPAVGAPVAGPSVGGAQGAGEA